MLNKELCKKCCKKNKEKMRSPFSISALIRESCWKNGYIDCPSDYVEKEETIVRYITELPPSKCPFFLEHILTNQPREI